MGEDIDNEILQNLQRVQAGQDRIEQHLIEINAKLKNLVIDQEQALNASAKLDGQIDAVVPRKASLADLLALCDPHAPRTDEELAWDQMAPVGREFGNPDYERLMKLDEREFQLKLTSLINACRELPESVECTFTPQELDDTANVQAALGAIGSDVSFGVAGCIWRQYSNSLAASWMSGAESIDSAKSTLIAYVYRLPPSGGSAMP